MPDYEATSRKVDLEFACDHPQTTIRKKVASNEAISFWKQCDRCGCKASGRVKKASLTESQIKSSLTWDDRAESRYYAERKKYFDMMWEEEKKRVNAAWWRAYNEYLQTGEWKHKRQIVIDRAQGVCEGCGEAAPTEVHHFSYDDVGREFLFQLAAFCRMCHDRWHEKLDSTVPFQLGRPSASSPPQKEKVD